MQEMAEENKDDMISLEDLVRDAAPEGGSTPTAPPVPVATSVPTPDPQTASPAARSAPAVVEPPANVDDVLSVEDPKFAEQINELKKQGEEAEKVEAEIEPLDLETIAKPKSDPIAKIATWILKPVIKILLKVGKKSAAERVSRWPATGSVLLREIVPLSIDLAKSSAAGAKSGLTTGAKNFKGLPRKSKVLLLLAIVLGALAVSTFRFALTGKLPLGLGPKFLKTFAEVADKKWEYKADEPLEEFTDPLYHPEHVITVERLVVNLKAPGDGTNPMGLFEFYFEANTQEAAVELKDRDGEVRDTISRSLEQMSYEDLISPAGKEKMKVLMRKNVNQLLTRGQVRRIFLKTIVLKP